MVYLKNLTIWHIVGLCLGLVLIYLFLRIKHFQKNHISAKEIYEKERKKKMSS